jgi:hypothetical protein
LKNSESNILKLLKKIIFIFIVLGSFIFLLSNFPKYFYVSFEKNEYGGEGTLYANRILLSDKAYIIITGHTGASNGYFGKASMTVEGGKCNLKIDRLFWEFDSSSSDFQYIFPDIATCKSVIMGSGEVYIVNLEPSSYTSKV